MQKREAALTGWLLAACGRAPSASFAFTASGVLRAGARVRRAGCHQAAAAVVPRAIDAHLDATRCGAATGALADLQAKPCGAGAGRPGGRAKG
jgi:hypothetical protein